MSWAEAKWVVDNVKKQLAYKPNNMKSFTAFSVNGTTVGLRFTEPDDSYDSAGNLICTVKGVVIRMSAESYPTTPYEGTEVINNIDLGKYTNTTLEVTGLTKGTTYYFSAFPYSTDGVYNISSNNRASAFPADGEVASVSITVDDNSGFSGVTVTCVDETDSTSTLSSNLTKDSRVASFTIPIGHKYHITFGACDGYIQTVTTTETRTSVAGTTSEYSSSYHYWTASINVNYPTDGSTLTCSSGSTSYTASGSTGTYAFKVHKAGTWTLTLSNGSKSVNRTATVTNDGDSVNVTIAYFSATISVKYPSGSTVTLTGGSESQTSNTSGNYIFTVGATGTYFLSCTDGTNTTSGSVTISSDGESKSIELSYIKIYGISRPISSTSTAWTRTDDAVGKSATASVGTVSGNSDFDSCYPWSEMKRETLSTGDVMVKIPKFWFKREITNGTEYIKIADKPTTGFFLHPAFTHNGTTQEYIYVGAYETGSGNVSKKGVSPLVNKTRAQFRSEAKAKGSGWSLFDFSSKMAVDMLYLIEFADNNSQARVGRGYCDNNSSAITTGSCDSVPNLTGRPAGTDGKTGVVYRGIENYWGNIWEFFDGLNINSGTPYICNNQSSYADDTSSGYTRLSISDSTSNGYISAEGYDANNPAYMIPTAVSGSETTGFADYYYYDSGWRVACRSGAWYDGSNVGVFFLCVVDASSDSSSSIGSRLLNVPA